MGSIIRMQSFSQGDLFWSDTVLLQIVLRGLKKQSSFNIFGPDGAMCIIYEFTINRKYSNNFKNILKKNDLTLKLKTNFIY